MNSIQEQLQIGFATWVESEIKEWVDSRIQERNQEGPK
jgi:predicted DNA-binding transcriptional regulator AlpA